MKKENFITRLIIYAYKGLMACIYFIIGKKNKIGELFNNDNTNSYVSVDELLDDYSNTEIKKVDAQTEKLHFSYKARNKNGKIIRSTFDAYNIEQAKRFLIQEGLEIIEIKPRGKLDIDIPNVIYQMSPTERLTILKALREKKINCNYEELIIKLTESEKKYLFGGQYYVVQKRK